MDLLRVPNFCWSDSSSFLFSYWDNVANIISSLRFICCVLSFGPVKLYVTALPLVGDFLRFSAFCPYLMFENTLCSCYTDFSVSQIYGLL